MKFIRTIICVGLFLTGTLAYSQSSEYDQVLVLVGEADSTLYDNPERSLDLAEEANALAKSLKNDSLIALTLNRMGSAQWSLGNEIKALENIQASLQLAEASKLEAIVAKNLGNIGNIYAASGLDLDAIGYYKSELELQKNLGNKFRLFAVNNNIGKSFLDLRMYDSARNYLNAAGAYLDQSFEQFHSIFFFNHAELNFAVGNYDLADLLLRMTYQNSERFSSKRGLIRANQLRAELDLTLGFPKKALLQAELAFELARESKVKELIYICSKTLSKCFAALGRFEEAYEKEVLHEQYLDSVRSVNTINELELLSYYQRLFKLRVLETKNTTNRELAEKRELIIHELVIALVVAAVLIAVIVLVVRELGIRKRELEKLNSFKAKIFAIVSHDLKSPIQSVSSVIEMFNQKLITKEEIEPFIPEVQEKTSNLMNLLNNVFLWAEGQMEGENLSKEEFTLLSVIKDLESELKDRLDKKGISLAYETAKEITLYSDAGIVRILLRNLIVNAIKYSHPNSSIEINCIRGNQTNVLEVIDTGIGMAEETVNGLFTGEIDSTDGTAGEKGNGLGLALCYDFVRRLGGTIAVESTLGKGSVFRVTIKD